VLRGDRLRFVHAGRTFEGRVDDASIEGEGWRAVRAP
jgi:hypothetical protein